MSSGASSSRASGTARTGGTSTYSTTVASSGTGSGSSGTGSGSSGTGSNTTGSSSNTRSSGSTSTGTTASATTSSSSLTSRTATTAGGKNARNLAAVHKSINQKQEELVAKHKSRMLELSHQREKINTEFSTIVSSCKQPNVNMPSATSAETQAQLASAFRHSQPALEARLSALKNGNTLEDAELAVPEELRQFAPHEQGNSEVPYQGINLQDLHHVESGWVSSMRFKSCSGAGMNTRPSALHSRRSGRSEYSPSEYPHDYQSMSHHHQHRPGTNIYTDKPVDEVWRKPQHPGTAAPGLKAGHTRSAFHAKDLSDGNLAAVDRTMHKYCTNKCLGHRTQVTLFTDQFSATLHVAHFIIHE